LINTIAIGIVALVVVSVPARGASCWSTITADQSGVDWAKGDPEWIQAAGSVPSTAAFFTTTVPASGVYLLVYGIRAEREPSPLKEISNLAILFPPCAAYESVATPLNLPHHLVTDVVGGDTDVSLRSESTVKVPGDSRAPRTSIPSPHEK
jgi:hypothetical protein